MNRKRARVVFSEAISSNCDIYEANFRNFEELHNAGVRHELAVGVIGLLCEARYNFRCQFKLEITSHDLFGTNDMDNFSELAKS